MLTSKHNADYRIPPTISHVRVRLLGEGEAADAASQRG
jgi:hypothetical protein